MTDNSRPTLERIARRVPVPESAYDRLLRRRNRKKRNQRLSAVALAIVLTLLTMTGLMRAFGNSERPAIEPTPTPVDRGIFSGMGGWIAYGYGVYYGSYGDRHYGGVGIWAMDPERRGIQEQLSTRSGEPLAWSSDGSKLLILRQTGQGSAVDQALYVLNADGSETLLIDSGCASCLSGGSFSPDGSKVIYGYGLLDTSDSGIYVVDAAGGTPRRLLEGRRLQAYGPRVRSMLQVPTLSPDGSQIAYFDGLGDHDNSLRVMNADGSGSHVLLKDAGMMKSSAGLRYLGWSPDGRRLVFEMGYGPYSIYVVGADGSGLQRVIANGAHPEWSPDGSRIAYNFAPLNSAGPLMIAEADGTHVQRFDGARSGPWNPLGRAESLTQAHR
jgi:Tol biopolymer transport system component